MKILRSSEKYALQAINESPAPILTEERVSFAMNFIADCLDKEQKYNQALKWRRAAVAIKNDETIASHTQQDTRKGKSGKKASKRKSRRG
ncbi:Oidioi.mRNA.OKI2018_I69.XSR.g15868.t1.cds [Oikopleura dioica]|uniref:Oidioi.mRNA.OKI2018_I69.XSR.g15868.t1.cds n=1 Tax=Oikopleura dioica TaxID=34765 RepID=A0ABN7SE75_OIKDI|nr:Oidioi.mRNA.OKI2018_I69.XSR.g15868.t1.cds [Oikopleura dioica]